MRTFVTVCGMICQLVGCWTLARFAWRQWRKITASIKDNWDQP